MCQVVQELCIHDGTLGNTSDMMTLRTFPGVPPPAYIKIPPQSYDWFVNELSKYDNSHYPQVLAANYLSSPVTASVA